MEQDRLLINEGLLLVKKHEQELELQEQLQDQELTIPMQILLINEGDDLEMRLETEETQFLIPLDQDSTKVLILQEKMDLNSRWEEGIICHRARILLALVLIITKEAKTVQNTQLATNLIQNLQEMHQAGNYCKKVDIFYQGIFKCNACFIFGQVIL